MYRLESFYMFSLPKTFISLVTGGHIKLITMVHSDSEYMAIFSKHAMQ